MKFVESPITGLKNAKCIDRIDVKKIIEQYQLIGVDVKRFFFGIEYVKIYKCKKTGYRFYYPYQCIGDSVFYSDLSKNKPNYYSSRWEHKKAIKFLNKNSNVLEIGSGFGSFLSLLKQEKIKGDGLELNPHATDVCKKEGLNVKQKNITDVVCEDSNYNIICAFQVLEHITNIQEFFLSASKILKHGGKIIIGVPNNNPYLFISDKFHTLNLPPHHAGLWNKKSLKKLAKIYNLKVEKIEFEPLSLSYNYFLNLNINSIKLQLLRKIAGKLIQLFPNIIKFTICKLFHGRNILIVYKKL